MAEAGNRNQPETVALGSSPLYKSESYTGGYLNNPNYKLVITHHGRGERVVAYLPEQFHFRLQNDYESF